MDQVFGIVHDHDAEAHVVPRLVVFHTLVNPVEAVALRGGSVMRAGSDVHARMTAGLPGDGADGGSVVGVHADEKMVVPVLNCSQVVFEHAADHGVLVP